MSVELIAALVSIPIALISGAVGLLAARSANRASRMNTEAATRVDMEKEAFVRAREHLVNTIESLKGHIEGQDKRIDDLEADLKTSRDESKALRRQMARMAAGLPPEEEHNHGST